jgi:hypothetical protein
VPAKRIIILDRDDVALTYRAALWADVPAGNQIARSDPNATSVVYSATPAEIQAIRDGLVAETVVTWTPTATTAFSLAAAQAALVTLWNTWQTDITNQTLWSDYGRFYDNAATWQAATGVPFRGMRESEEGQPTFLAYTPVSALAANKFHLVLYNNAPIATSQNLLAKIRRVIVQPSQTVVTGVLPSVFQLSRRTGLTTAPSGAGSFAAALMDSAQSLTPNIGLWNAPAVAPAGGTLTLFNEFTPQVDELKLSTLDAPTMAGLEPFAGQTVYDSFSVRPSRPLTIRPGQTLEIQQGATAGTGNVRILVIFTMG